MKIQEASDLHLEFFSSVYKQEKFINFLRTSAPEADTIVLAGDIIMPVHNIKRIIKIFAALYKHVIFVAGNHEFYKSSFDSIFRARQIINESVTNAHWLDCNVVEIDGLHFGGATAWFHDDPLNKILSTQMNDFSLISSFEENVYEQNRKGTEFFKRNCRVGAIDIAISHHAPTYKSISQEFLLNALNRFYVSPTLEEIFYEQQSPRVWIHGHTHISFDYLLEKTRVICNPYGYHMREVNKAFNTGLVINVE